MPREINLYLCDILDAINKIQDYTSGFSYNDFTSNRVPLLQ